MVSIQQLHKNAQAAMNRGAFQDAYQLCQNILQRNSKHADAWFFMSVITAAKGGLTQALEWVDKALSINADSAEYLAHKARFLCLLRRHEHAIATADKARTCTPLTAIDLDTLGVVYSKTGDHQKALAVLKEAVALQPDNPQFHFNLASSQQFSGQLTHAEASYEQAIALKPDFFRAHWALSELLKTGSDGCHLQRLETLLSAGNLTSVDELHLCHAIAREYEHRREPKQMFAFLKRGKDRHAKQIHYTFESDKQLFEALRYKFTGETISACSPGKSDETPVFIVGMPRSGTTLIDRILDVHSKMMSLGELQNFGIAVKRASNTKSPRVLATEVIDALEKTDFNRVGSDYLSSVQVFRKGGLRFVDKLPLNFFYIGHIFLAFPKAKIICMRRHPLDTCLSNYKQLFAVNFSYYNYAYNLEDIGRYYLQFDKLMAHWQALFGDRILQVEYEVLVKNPLATTKAVLAYCDLPWEQQCLEFYKVNTTVSTASATQVRQPIYSSAVHSWKQYRCELASLITLLRDTTGTHLKDIPKS